MMYRANPGDFERADQIGHAFRRAGACRMEISEQTFGDLPPDERARLLSLLHRICGLDESSAGC